MVPHACKVESRTLQALEVGQICHIRLYVLVNMCIGEINKCRDYVEL